jgi:hypothetical protein
MISNFMIDDAQRIRRLNRRFCSVTDGCFAKLSPISRIMETDRKYIRKDHAQSLKNLVSS